MIMIIICLEFQFIFCFEKHTIRKLSAYEFVTSFYDKRTTERKGI